MNRQLFIRLIFLLFSISLLGAVFLLFWPAFLPFIISYVLVFALKPLVVLLERRGYSNRISVIVVFVGFLGALAIAISVFLPILYNELLGIRDNLPMYQNILFERMKDFEEFVSGRLGGFLNVFAINVSDPGSVLNSYIFEHVMFFMKKIPSLLLNLIPIAINILIIPFSTFLILYDGYTIRKKLLRLVPNRYFEISLNIFYSLNHQFGLLLRGMFVTTILVSFLVSSGLWLIGLPYPMLIGIFSGVANLIPYAGPVVGILAASLIALMTGMPPIFYGYILLVFLIVNVVENVFIQPLVMARAANLHPLLVIFLVLAGSQVGGILGMLLAVPISSLAVTFLRIMYSEFKRPVRPPFATFSSRSSGLFS